LIRHCEERSDEAIYRVIGQAVLKGFVRLYDCVERRDEFAGEGDESDLVRFSIGSEAVVESLAGGLWVDAVSAAMNRISIRVSRNENRMPAT
jgi:hypothetical protein